MRIGRALRSVARRWYVLLPLLALTVVLTVKVGEGVRPQHEVHAVAIMVPGEGAGRSPYGDVRETVHVLSLVLGSQGAQQQIADRGVDGRYVIDVGRNSSQLRVDCVNDSAQRSRKTCDAVLEVAQHLLSQHQADAGVPSSARARLQVLQSPAERTVVEASGRTVAVVALTGALLSLLGTALVDDALGWRRRRGRAARTGPVEERVR